MNYELHKGTKCFVGVYKNKPIAFCGILHFPHPYCDNIKRVHRLVVLPDYQGIGIGNKFLDWIAEYYKKQKYRFCITTSTPALLYSFKKSNHWRLKQYGRKKKHGKLGKTGKFDSSKRFTTSWEYI